MPFTALQKLVRLAQLGEQWTGSPDAGGLGVRGPCLTTDFWNAYGFCSVMLYYAQIHAIIQKLISLATK